MIIANKLRQTNRAEYLLYLWQVEDILRAYGCDSDKIKEEYLSRFDLSPEERKNTEQWYKDLCNMMLAEGCKDGGHLQICRNVLSELEDLHARLVNSQNFPYYRGMYYKVLPYLVELRGKGVRKDESELQTCFDALYGVMMLRLQKKAVSAETVKAVKDISTMLGQLSDYYFKDQETPLET